METIQAGAPQVLPAAESIERGRRPDRRSGEDRRTAADPAPLMTGDAATRTARIPRVSSCRHCTYSRPRSLERGGLRLCLEPNGLSSIVDCDQGACTAFRPWGTAS